ncbi:MAG: class I SAM-dependent methyltransferase [Actinomycetota bacterium]|nr:class I SAM-dependent methyltransferase [Actinomycetota bacterium]
MMARVLTTAWDEPYAVSEMVCSGSPNTWVRHHCAELLPGRMLDLAGGEGRNALWLAQRGWQATVVDFSQSALDRASECSRDLQVADAVEVVRADVRKYLPTGRAYDLVLIAYLPLPPGERNTVLNLAVSAVAPGGRLMLIGHDERNLVEGIGGPQDANLLSNPVQTATQLEALGLRVECAQTQPREVQTDDGARLAFDAVVIAARI